MLFISETCKGWKPIPYTQPHSQGCASGTSTITGNSEELAGGGWQSAGGDGAGWRTGSCPPSVVQGPPPPGLGTCWHFIIMETAFAPKNNHLQSPHFGESLGLFSGTGTRADAPRMDHSLPWSSTWPAVQKCNGQPGFAGCKTHLEAVSSSVGRRLFIERRTGRRALLGLLKTLRRQALAGQHTLGTVHQAPHLHLKPGLAA